MTELVIVRTEAGLQGLGEKNVARYDKFKAKAKGMEVGETLSFSWKEPRSPKFHRLFFAMLGNLFDVQEQFADDNQLRSWLTVGAGYCDFVPGPTGRMVALPRSIAWDKMDDGEFHGLCVAVWAFLRTEHALRFLWPPMTAQAAGEAVERLLAGWEG